MTDRLYYTDPYAREFDARIVQAEAVDGGFAVVLDRTAFYPTSGGQPFDTGTLGAARVLDVVDDPARSIVHVVDAELRAGDQVRGAIDWDRRFDHMQQHTGQHVLSAAFDRLSGVRTESFHLGAELSTIDLARVVSAAEIAGAEEDANRVVWENRPVTIRFADAAGAAPLPMRKASLRTGTLRLIDVEDYDVSACGGTHVARTGAIGIIAVTGSEKVRGGTRIEFACGGRALRRVRLLRDATAASIRLLSVLPAELPATVERLQADLKAAHRAVRDLQTRLGTFEAERLFGRDPTARTIVEVLDGWDQNGLKSIASSLTARPGLAVVLISAPAPSSIVVARSADVQIDAAAIVRRLVERFGGKGGGRPDLAQAGGLHADPPAIAAVARELLTAC